MADPLATPADVVEIFRPLDAQEETNTLAMLRYVSALIRGKVKSLDARISAGTLDKDLVKLAAIMPVQRVLMNKEGYRQKSESTGPFSDSFTLDAAISSGLLYVSDDDVKGLLPVVRHKSGFGSMSVAMGLR